MKADHTWIVICEYDTDVFFGPFATLYEAKVWMNSQPDDEDLMDMYAVCLNNPSVRE